MKANIKVFIVGLIMGAAEVVPGVSGGTIAFVSGFYERLVDAIHRLTPMRLFDLRTMGIRELWKSLDMNFLLLLFGAMAISILLLARGVAYLLVNHPVGMWSFFFGLVLTSVFVVGRKLSPLNLEVMMAIAAGTAVGLVVSQIVPLEAEVSPLVLFAGGCIAVCAWILPGLSGSFVLLILGLYQSVIVAVKDLDFITLSYLGAGCIVGLMSFSQILSLLLRRFRNSTIAVLVGFMLGSLVKIWPWKHTTSYQLKPDGGQIPVVQEPVLPGSYQYLTGEDPAIFAAIAAFIVGCALILVLDRLALLGGQEKS